MTRELRYDRTLDTDYDIDTVTGEKRRLDSLEQVAIMRRGTDPIWSLTRLICAFNELEEVLNYIMEGVEAQREGGETDIALDIKTIKDMKSRYIKEDEDG